MPCSGTFRSGIPSAFSAAALPERIKEVRIVNISQRARQVSPFYVMELLEKARELEAQGKSIIHMEVGEPGFETPLPVKEEAVCAAKDGKTFYTHSLGIPELRSAISRHYRDLHKVDVPPERVIVTNGSSGAFVLLFAVLLERGRTLAIPDPGYPCYRNIALLVDCGILSIPVTDETGYEITAAHLDRLDTAVDLLIVTNPSNPTGTVYRDGTLEKLHDRLCSLGGTLIVDEIYSELVYNTGFRSSAAISDNIIVVNGFSKAYAMTGWRLGWMIVPGELVRPVQKFAQNLFISPPSLSQYAAISALDQRDAVERMRRLYQERRDFLVPRLKSLGFSVPVNPSGAFYVYAGIERFDIDSMDFVNRALLEAGVAITPGYDFGSFGAGSHVRFSYANTLENIKEGCERLGRWLPALFK